MCVNRVRTATSKVITVLLRAGVDPNVLTKASRSRGHESSGGDAITLNISPLHLILQRAMSLATAQHADDVSVSDQHSSLQTQQRSLLPHNTTTTTYLDDSVASVTNAAGSAFPSKMRVSGRRVWVKAVHTLVRAGAEWNASMVVQPGHSQLYMFLHAFPPPPEDALLYRSLLQGALAAPGMDPLSEDDNGRSALFVLCEQMAKTATEKCPSAGDILSLVLQHIPNGGIGGSDRSGRTVFDLEQEAPSSAVEWGASGVSCFQASRQLLINAGTAHSGGRGRWREGGDEEDRSSRSSSSSHGSGSGSIMNFRPPNERQLRHQQLMMPVDEYVINGVERMN
jgi:hypothetical protein